MDEIISLISQKYSTSSDKQRKRLLSELKTHAIEVRDKISEIIGSPVVADYPAAEWEPAVDSE